MDKENTPISMKSLEGKGKLSRIKLVLISVLVTILVILSFDYIQKEYIEEKPTEKSNVLTLEKVVIAYAPETKSIIFLDRNTGQVQLTLSDSVSLAIFALKSNEIAADYTSKVTK